MTVSLKLEVIDTIDTCWSLVPLVSETETSSLLTFFCGSSTASFFFSFHSLARTAQGLFKTAAGFHNKMKVVAFMMVLHLAVLFTQALFTLNAVLSVHDRQAALNHFHALTYL